MTSLPRIDAMKLSQVAEPFDDPEWIFELKHDGFRALAYVAEGKCALISRRRNDYKSFGQLRTAIGESLRVKDAVLDGEIVCLNSYEHTVFNELLHRCGEPIFSAFDLIWLNGRNLRQQPLPSRKGTLERLIRCAKCPRLLCAQHVQGKGSTCFALCARRMLKGLW